MKEVENIKNILKSLDGKSARVTTTGLSVEPSLSGLCKMEFNDSWGIKLLVSFKWNEINVIDDIKRILINSDIPRGAREDAIELLNAELKEKCYIQAGRLSWYNISNINIKFCDKGLISMVEITYLNNGGTVKIFEIK